MIPMPKCRDCRTAMALCRGPDLIDRCQQCHDKERRRAVFCGDDDAEWHGADCASPIVGAAQDALSPAPHPFVRLTASGRTACPTFKWGVGRILTPRVPGSHVDDIVVEDGAGSTHRLKATDIIAISEPDARHHARLVALSGFVPPGFGAMTWFE